MYECRNVGMQEWLNGLEFKKVQKVQKVQKVMKVQTF